jgi:translation initiation factor 2B subunit (eIF-2B alpha/beta/delta family)
MTAFTLHERRGKVSSVFGMVFAEIVVSLHRISQIGNHIIKEIIVTSQFSPKVSEVLAFSREAVKPDSRPRASAAGSAPHERGTGS